jgi:hypothetical protein
VVMVDDDGPPRLVDVVADMPGSEMPMFAR